MMDRNNSLKRKIIVRWAVMILAGLCCMGMAPRPPRLTLLVIPARYTVVQLGMDMVKKYSTVLISYQQQGETEAPLLHVWNGSTWIHISIEDYRDLRFLKKTPYQVIFVGEEDQCPDVLIDEVRWADKKWLVSAVDTAGLVNNLGTIWSFKKSDWQWFARRYNLELKDMNEPRRRESWYDRPYLFCR